MLHLSTAGRGAAAVAALLTGLFLTGAAEARAKPATKPVTKPQATPYGAQVAELRHVHALLARADRDYKGHRVQAMKDIHAAIVALHPHHKNQQKGTGAKGGGEKQSVSDAQLRSAIKQLRNVENQLATTVNPATNKAVNHIRAAIKQLEIALTIR
jgi:hypothetical protein